MATARDLVRLGREIEQALIERERSQSWLARQSGVAQSTISRLIHGKHARPDPETLAALARVLEVDTGHFWALAGMSLLAPGPLDPEAAYIARRISELPPSWRERAIDAVSGSLDAVYQLFEEYGREAPVPDPKSGGDEGLTDEEVLERARKAGQDYLNLEEQWVQEEEARKAAKLNEERVPSGNGEGDGNTEL